MIRRLEEAKTPRHASFEADDVVIYPQLPDRKIIVAHCYEQRIGVHRRWIVAETNGDTHRRM